MGLRHWVGRDLQPYSEDRYWGAGESRGHALHQSLHLHQAANQLPVFLGDAESAQPKLPRTHFQGHPWRGFEEGGHLVWRH